MQMLVWADLTPDGIENSLKIFEREMKQAIIPFVEKNYRALN